MSADRAFIDTNVFIYIQRTDVPNKAKISKKTIDFFECVASTQVLNEVCNVLTRKYPSPKEKIERVLHSIQESCTMVTVNNDYPQKALDYHFRYSISYYDALMVAAALEAHCKYLISEDMQDGLIIENKLQIVNIYEHADLLMPVL
jgi:predicted nucleic acid-binding protein